MAGERTKPARVDRKKPVGHEPTGFPIIIPEDSQQALLSFKGRFDVATAELATVNAEIAALGKRQQELQEIVQHCATGMRIELRAVCGEEGIEKVRMRVDPEDGTVEVYRNA